MSHVIPLVFGSSNKAMLDIIRITRLFPPFNEILTRAVLLLSWQHSCGNFYHRQMKSYIPACVWTVCSLALPLVWHGISPLLLSALCDRIAFDVTSFFPALFTECRLRPLKTSDALWKRFCGHAQGTIIPWWIALTSYWSRCVMWILICQNVKCNHRGTPRHLY